MYRGVWLLTCFVSLVVLGGAQESDDATAAAKIPGYDGACEPGATWTNSIGMEFAYIPAGTFLMGDPREGEAYRAELRQEWEARIQKDLESDSPHMRMFAERKKRNGFTPRSRHMQHRVQLTRPILIQTTEVTREQWKRVMDSGATFKKSDILPKNDIGWTDAVEFCQRLSRLEGRTYRLPTEAEWEYACRAGAETDYSWGDGWKPGVCNVENLDKPGPRQLDSTNRAELNAMGLPANMPVPVKSFAPNAWGLYDMHGNVAEWCWDKWSEPTGAPAIDPKGPPEGTDAAGRLLRGGSYRGTREDARSFARIYHYSAIDSAGLRVVLESFEKPKRRRRR